LSTLSGEDLETFPHFGTIAGTLYYRLAAQDLLDSTPFPLRQLLKRYYREQWARNERLAQVGAEVNGYYAAQSIPLLFLKGPHIALDYYGDLAARRMADLDLLVRKADLDRAEQVLLSNGFIRKTVIFPYRRFVIERALHHFVYQRAGVTIELHWRVTPFPGARIVEDHIWERQRAFSCGGTRAHTVNAEWTILLFILSLFSDIQQHIAANLKGWGDLYTILRKEYDTIHWGSFMAERAQEGTGPIVSYMIYELDRLFPCLDEMPELARALTPPVWARKYSLLARHLRGGVLNALRNKQVGFRLWGKKEAATWLWWLLTLPSRLIGHA